MTEQISKDILDCSQSWLTKDKKQSQYQILRRECPLKEVMCQGEQSHLHFATRKSFLSFLENTSEDLQHWICFPGYFKQ